MSTEDTPKPAGLPDPDTHCWDDDTNNDVWSYSQGLMRATIDAAVANERERCARLAVDVAAAACKKYEADMTPVKQPYANNRLMHVGWSVADAIRGPNVQAKPGATVLRCDSA